MKKYFVVLNHIEEHYNSKWDKRSAISWAKEMASRGDSARVYEAEFIKGFDSEVKVIDDDKAD